MLSVVPQTRFSGGNPLDYQGTLIKSNSNITY